MNSWFVYIVKCKDGSLYTGITTDPKQRVLKHNAKKGARSLYGKIPVSLVYTERAQNQVTAAQREREIKGWSRQKKEALIQKGLP